MADTSRQEVVTETRPTRQGLSPVSRRREWINSQLKCLTEQLVADLGEELVSVILSGPFARSLTLDSKAVPINVLLVVDHVNLELLSAAAGAIQRADRKLRLATMIMSVEELEASTDVFPIRFLDMQQCHSLLWGQDVLSALRIGEDHLRLRCEQELKNVLLRLQNQYLHRSRRRRPLRDTLVTAFSSYLVTLRAALYLFDRQTPDSDREVADAAGRTLRLDADILLRIMQLRDSGDLPNHNTLLAMFGSFLLVVHQAACILDEHAEKR